jgi:hypothetical protein
MMTEMGSGKILSALQVNPEKFFRIMISVLRNEMTRGQGDGNHLP